MPDKSKQTAGHAAGWDCQEPGGPGSTEWCDFPDCDCPRGKDLEDCLDCSNPFCSNGRCIEQLHAEARRRDAMWKEVGP